MTRRGRIVQHIGNRIRQGRTPLCVEIGRVCITLRRIQRCRSGRSKRRICKPTEEIVPRTNRPKEGIHRVFDRIARESPILIVCRLCHGIVQVIAKVISLGAPLRVVVSISRRCRLGIQSCNRTSRKGRIIVPTFKVVPGPGHRQERNVRIRNIIRPLVIRVVCQNCSHRGRIHIVRILNLIPDWVPVCGHCDHITVLRREQGRRRAVRIGLTVRSAPVQKAVTVHCKAVRQVCSRSAGNGLIRHGAGRRMPRRCVRDKLHRILVRVSGHRSRYIANRIGTDCPAARSSVVKARRCERRRILRRRGRNRLAVVKVHGDARHAVVANKTGHRHIGRIPEESLGRCHGTRIHGNGERHIDRTTAHIAECAVRALHEEGAAAGHIDGAIICDIAARRNTEGLAVRIDHDTRRDVLRHNRVVGQRNRRIAVPARPSDCVVQVAEVVLLAANFHIGDIARNKRNRLVGCSRILIIGTELDEETKDIDSRVPVIQVRQIVPCAGTMVNLHKAFSIVCSSHHRGVRLSGTPFRIGTVNRAASVGFIKFRVCLRTILPSPLMPASTRCVSVLHQVGKNTRHTCSAVIVPVRHARRIINTFNTCATGPSTFHRNIIEGLILLRGCNGSKITLHPVQLIGFREIIALCPADFRIGHGFHIHIVVFCTIACDRIRNICLGDGGAGRQVICAVSERNLDLLRCPCARQVELKVVLDKSLRVRRCKRRRENNLVELVRTQNVRKGLNTGRCAEELYTARIDLEIHRGDAGSRCVGDRHIL